MQRIPGSLRLLAAVRRLIIFKQHYCKLDNAGTPPFSLLKMKSSAHPSHRRQSLQQPQGRRGECVNHDVDGKQQSAATAAAADDDSGDSDWNLDTEHDSLRIDAVGYVAYLFVMLMGVMLLRFVLTMPWNKNGLMTSPKAHKAFLHWNLRPYSYLLPQSEGSFWVSPLHIENQWFVPGTMEDLYGPKKTTIKKHIMFSVKKTGFLSERIANFYTTMSESEGVVELDRFVRTEGKSSRTIQIPLYGGPNEGYCAMIAIGSIHVQKANSLAS